MKKNIVIAILILCLLVGSVLAVVFFLRGNGEVQESSKILDTATDAMLDAYGLSSGEDLKVEEIRTYEDETAVYYSQTYGGVEIYGSSLLSVTGEETCCVGTYYDLTNAFGEEFDSLVAEASKIPEWMYNRHDSVSIDWNSLRPVIYITDDQEAVVCRCFTVRVESQDLVDTVELVMDLDGKNIYSASSLDAALGFDDTEVSNGTDSLMLSKQDGKYYAYNSEYNFYLANPLYEDNITVSNYATNDGKNWKVKVDKSLMYRTDTAQWDKAGAKEAFTAMSEYYRVLQWYDQSFGYKGIDGKGGASVLFLCKEIGGTAANMNGIAVALSADVINAPEVLAHEVGHSVFHYSLARSGGAVNQTASLNEAISDVFACLYLDDGEWVIGAKLKDGGAKDIPGNKRTMDQYLYDRYSENDETKDNVKDSFLLVVDFIFGPVYKDSGSSNGTKYTNSYIISHTMYEIWDEVFDRNSEAFGRVFYRSLRYLPKNPKFSDFRDAFLHSMNQNYDTETVAYTSTFFDVAKVYTNKMVNIKKVASTPETDAIPFVNMRNMTLDALSHLKWERFECIGTLEYTYYYEGQLGETLYTYMVYSEEEPMAEQPQYLSIYAEETAGPGYPVTDDITIGMTKQEVENAVGSSLVEGENRDSYGFDMMLTVDGVDLRLLFRFVGDDEILVGAQLDLVYIEF